MHGVERRGVSLHTTIFECCGEGSERILSFQRGVLGVSHTPGIIGRTHSSVALALKSQACWTCLDHSMHLMFDLC